MAMLSKNIYNPDYFQRLCPVLEEFLPQFDWQCFIFRVFDNTWPDLELKERVRHICRVVHDFLPPDFTIAAKQLVMISHVLRNTQSHNQHHQNIFIPHYIEVYGQDHPEDALNALGEITKLVSAEFAIRPFIIRYPDLSVRYLYKWSMSDDGRVRRLSRKGYRHLKGLPASKSPFRGNSLLAENVL